MYYLFGCKKLWTDWNKKQPWLFLATFPDLTISLDIYMTTHSPNLWSTFNSKSCPRDCSPCKIIQQISNSNKKWNISVSTVNPTDTTILDLCRNETCEQSMWSLTLHSTHLLLCHVHSLLLVAEHTAWRTVLKFTVRNLHRHFSLLPKSCF